MISIFPGCWLTFVIYGILLSAFGLFLLFWTGPALLILAILSALYLLAFRMVYVIIGVRIDEHSDW